MMGYNRSNTSPLLKRFLACVDDLVAAIGKKQQRHLAAERKRMRDNESEAREVRLSCARIGETKRAPSGNARLFTESRRCRYGVPRSASWR
jgi:hypothetical protein